MERIAVIGLGYVGLPIALGFARRFPGTIGFDSNPQRIEALRQGIDSTHEVSADELHHTSLQVTTDPHTLSECTCYVVCVPTPIDASHRPNLGPLLSASRTVGLTLSKGNLVVYESTVYPGVTQEVCRPLLAQCTGLTPGVDFVVGYSPERINPGDQEHSLERVVKVVSGEDDSTLSRVARLYQAIVPAGVHRAPSIRVAEAAKVIENTQRDLNIALMNELAMIFDRLNISTREVLEAAGTKWNFLRFTPGLVGGHCIGVDPYYLTAKAEEVGYHPQVVLAGRRVNDGMGRFVAQRLVKALRGIDRPLATMRVGVLGLTFKENVPDVRNSKVPDVLDELAEYGIVPRLHDPLASASDAAALGQRLTDRSTWGELDALVLAVPHQAYLDQPLSTLIAGLQPGGVVFDIKSRLDPSALPDPFTYLSL